MSMQQRGNSKQKALAILVPRHAIGLVQFQDLALNFLGCTKIADNAIQFDRWTITRSTSRKSAKMHLSHSYFRFYPSGARQRDLDIVKRTECKSRSQNSRRTLVALAALAYLRIGRQWKFSFCSNVMQRGCWFDRMSRVHSDLIVYF